MHPLQKDCPRDDRSKHASWVWAAGVPDPGAMRPEAIPLIHPMLVDGISELLWDFGYRHHPTKQTKWVDGVAGLGQLAQVSDAKPKLDARDAMFEDFLKDNNPELLEMIRKAPAEERDRLVKDLEKNFDVLKNVISHLKDM